MTGRHRFSVLSIALGALIAYLSVQTVTGQHGLIAFMDLQRREAALAVQRDALMAERDRLEARAARLRNDSLDLDYLDERARATLAAGDPDEIVFIIEPGSS